MVESSPFPAITDLDRGEEDGVEIDIVLAHELEQADIRVVEPPSFPFFGVVGGDTDIPDARLEL